LSGKIKSNVGISAKVDVAMAGQVARSVGKAVRIIDNRPKES
jgi:phenylacetate-CoA ligase